MRFRLGSPLVICALAGTTAAAVIACSAVVQESSSPRTVATPLPVVTSLGGVKAPKIRAENAAKVLDLTDFTPLLSQPEFSGVARLIRDEEFRRAADELDRYLRGAESDKGLLPVRLNYLLGQIRQQAQQPDLALSAFLRAGTLASDRKWILADEAWLEAARLHLVLDQASSALDDLAHIDELDRADVLEVRAQIFVRLEKLREAEQTWAALVDRLSDQSEARHRALLGHAESLLHLAEDQELAAEKASLVERAGRDLAAAQLGLPTDHPISQRVEELKVRFNIDPKVGSNQELLAGIGQLIETGALEEAESKLGELSLSPEEQAGELGCRRAYYQGKLLAGQRKWGEAADALRSAVGECRSDPDLHAALLFNAGKYSAADGRDSAAVRYYEELEQDHSENSLADDARLRRAKSYKDMGAEARFVSLLSEMPDDYPNGDMTMEGVLLLALEQMVKHKWSEAATVLEGAAQLVRPQDSARGHEYAGTERYFLGRCLIELGEEERGLAEYESLIREVPLSYYMLHAYSRLLEVDKPRAKLALAESLLQATRSPFEFPYRPEYDTPAFQRAMELLMLGELQEGRAALSKMSSNSHADDSLIWGIALLFDRAGDAHFSHQLARGRLTDWLSHYPEGNWVEPWQIGFPRPYLDVVEKQSDETGVPPWLIYGVMREESTFVPDIESHAHAYGLMQIIAPTARGIGRKFNLPYSVRALKQPRYNIAIGTRVLSELHRRFKKNPLLSIPGYNAGPSRPGRWLSERPNIDFDLWVELIPFRETRRYTKRVLASRAAYAFLYYRDTADAALVLPKRLNLN